MPHQVEMNWKKKFEQKRSEKMSLVRIGVVKVGSKKKNVTNDLER